MTTLEECIDKLIELVPGGDATIGVANGALITHGPTNVNIDTNINGYYLTAPERIGSNSHRVVATPYFDSYVGDFLQHTTDPKAIVIGWLLCIIEHSAVQALQ